jgi:hypothetical protein
MTDASSKSESDVLQDLMIERLHAPREELMKLIALGYASDKAHAKAAGVVDGWLTRQDYAISVIKQRLRNTAGRAASAEAIGAPAEAIGTPATAIGIPAKGVGP